MTSTTKYDKCFQVLKYKHVVKTKQNKNSTCARSVNICEGENWRCSGYPETRTAKPATDTPWKVSEHDLRTHSEAERV